MSNNQNNNNKLTLGDRMKTYYENAYRFYLPRRLPIIIRVDMRAGHTYTRNFKRPVDDVMKRAMQETCLYLCENIQDCRFGYTQSDEISLVLYSNNPKAEPWFGGNIQKIVSTSAAMATAAFNGFMDQFIQEYYSTNISYTIPQFLEGCNMDPKKVQENVEKCYKNNGYATFDSRVFVLPLDEVDNYFIWRQQDASRNSILGLAQTLYSHKEMQGIKCNALQDKMFTEKGVNWNDLPTEEKRGSCCIKMRHVDVLEDHEEEHYYWTIHKEMPILTEQKGFVSLYLKDEKEKFE